MRLSRFATDRRRFHPIGKVDLRAHHAVTSESQWLVQIGGSIGAIDLVAVCAPAPRIEFAWSCALTDRLQTLAFAHRKDGASWLTCDISDTRAGIVERWTLVGGGQLSTAVCIPAITQDTPTPPPGTWFWDIRRDRIGAVAREDDWLLAYPWDDAAEERARDLQRRRRAADIAGIDHVQTCDPGQPFVLDEGKGRVEIRDVDRPWRPGFALAHDPATPLRCLARTAGQSLFADEAGRLLLVEPETRRVTLL